VKKIYIASRIVESKGSTLRFTLGVFANQEDALARVREDNERLETQWPTLRLLGAFEAHGEVEEWEVQ